VTRAEGLARAALIGGAGLLSALATIKPGLAGWGAAMAGFAVLWTATRFGLADHAHARFGAANMLTFGRASFVCLLLALAAGPALDGDARWLVVAAGALVLALDGVDGWLARRQGLQSDFGARFDMETDSAFMLALAVLAARTGDTGVWVLALGLPRYLFVAAAWKFPFLTAALPPSERRRAVCVLQGLALLACVAPIDDARPAAATGLVFLLWSFAADIAWLWRHAASRDGVPLGPRVAALFGLLRSLAIYHFIPGRAARLDRFYADFVPSGGLAIDVGAHVGNRVASWRRLGARVVAVEPQPRFADFLRRWFLDDPGVAVAEVLLDAADGTVALHVSDRHPTLATASDEFIRAAGSAKGFASVAWNRTIAVPATTLDALIARGHARLRQDRRRGCGTARARGPLPRGARPVVRIRAGREGSRARLHRPAHGTRRLPLQPLDRREPPPGARRMDRRAHDARLPRRPYAGRPFGRRLRATARTSRWPTVSSRFLTARRAVNHEAVSSACSCSAAAAAIPASVSRSNGPSASRQSLRATRTE
jgi:FkbM family methyltransferase